MTFVDILGGINCGLVFFFGASLSVFFAGGCKTRRDWAILFALCPVFLALQTLSWLVLGLDITKQLYPLYIHLPLLLVLTFGLKKPLGISLVSICAAYLCCQLPRCGGIMVAAATDSGLVGQIVYTIIIVPIFLFLLRYFVPPARDTMTESSRSMLLFGSLPIMYYFYDYTIAGRSNLLYSDLLTYDLTYSGGQVVAEILPTVAGLLYMVYTTAYRQQLQGRARAELLNSLMVGQLKQAESEVTSLRQAEAQAATYQHDMRHHLAAIDGFLAAGKPHQAEEYIKQVQADIETITPKRFCENELVNLLCSSFCTKAERMGVRLTLEATVPSSLAISDTELCALLSNGLENALNAVGALKENRRWLEFYCGVRLDKLLIEIKNPYTGHIQFRDGLPETMQPNHGCGCLSIRAITQTHRGLCEFTAESDVFTLRIVIPNCDPRAKCGNGLQCGGVREIC